MRHEIAAAPTGSAREHLYTFTLVETQTEIIRAIQQLRSTGCAQIALVVIHFLYESATNGSLSALSEERADQGSTFLLRNIRPRVRRTDQVFLCGHVCYFVLPGANLQGAEIVEERLWETLLWNIHNMDEQEGARPIQVAIGHGALPFPHASPDELLRAASEFSKRFGERPEQEHVSQRGAERPPREKEQSQPEERENLPRLARELGIPYLAPLPRHLPQRVSRVLNARLARELRCYPVGRDRNVLTVAMLNPRDHRALERLRQETGLRIFPVLTHPEALETVLKQL